MLRVFCFALGIVVVARVARLAPGHSFRVIRPVLVMLSSMEPTPPSRLVTMYGVSP